MPSKFIIASPGFQKTLLNLFYKIEFLDDSRWPIGKLRGALGAVVP